MSILILIARILFSLVFIGSGMGHLTKTEGMAQYAASKGVPAPRLVVIVTGVLLVVGGLSVLLGVYGRIGALALFIFLLPTAFMMHNFWTVTDPMARQNEMGHFLKDLALAGGALLIFACGTGALSLAGG